MRLLFSVGSVVHAEDVDASGTVLVILLGLS